MWGEGDKTWTCTLTIRLSSLLKTDFYKVGSQKVNGKIVNNLFTQPDSKLHAQMKRPIAPFFSMNSVLSIEQHINSVLSQFCSKLDEEFVKTRRQCNLGDWIKYYTYDVIGKITFSQPYGYLDKGWDFDGLITATIKGQFYLGRIGQMPILDYLLDKNPLFHIGPPSLQPLINILINRVAERYQGVDQTRHDIEEPDYLDKFMEARRNHPDIVDDAMVISYLAINTIAGTDTTASAIRSVIYYVLKNASIYARLKQEIRNDKKAQEDGIPISFRTARGMPFLEAVVRESIRMLPSIGLPLERCTPSTLTLPDGRQVPAGVKVGMNPYVLARNGTVWGDDADMFRPERWLQGHETNEQFRERLTRMNNADLAFGTGSRMCIGKNLAYMQIYKVVATLFERYDVELVDREREWTVSNSWLVTQQGLIVKLSRRK